MKTEKIIAGAKRWARNKAATHLEGATLLGLEGKDGDDIVRILTDRGTFVFEHYDDCCEWVRLESITGWSDSIIGEVVVVAEVRTEEAEHVSESGTWTFYTIQTNSGDITMRWLGESNGYYSEEVSVWLAVSE